MSLEFCEFVASCFVVFFFFLFFSVSSNLWHCLFFVVIVVGCVWLFARLTITFLVRNSSSIERQKEEEEDDDKKTPYHGQIDFFSLTFFFTHFIHCVCLCVYGMFLLLLYIYGENDVAILYIEDWHKSIFFHTTKIEGEEKNISKWKCCVYKSTLKFFWIVVKIRCSVCVCVCVLLSMNQIVSFPLLNVENETKNLKYVCVFVSLNFNQTFIFVFVTKFFSMTVFAW